MQVSGRVILIYIGQGIENNAERYKAQLLFIAGAGIITLRSKDGIYTYMMVLIRSEHSI